MKALRLQIKRAKEKLLQAQEEMDQLVNEYQTVLPHMNQAHDPLMKYLPLELMSSIFQIHAPPIPVDREPTGNGLEIDPWDEIEFRTIVASVCRGWRSVAVSTPQLWNYVLVWLDSPHVSTRDVEVTRAWFERSRKLPLSIRVYCSDPPEVSDGAHDMIRLLKQESYRWQMLDLRIPLKFSRQLIGEGSVFPMLESLRVEQDEIYMPDIGFATPNAAPKLVEVYLLHIHTKSMKIRWENITRVMLQPPCVDECLELFKNAPQLRACRLLYLPSHADRSLIPMWPNEIIHHQLEELAVEWPKSGDYSDFFSRINCPSLKELTVMSGKDGRGGPELASFFKRSSCPLKRLFLVDTVWDTDEFIEVLEQVPSLAELFVESDVHPKLQGGNLSPDNFFKALARPFPSDESSLHNKAQEIPFLPKLQVLEFQPAQTFSWSILPPIFGLSSEGNCRKPPSRPLKRFSVHQWRTAMPDMDRQTTSELLAVRAAGVELDFDLCGDSILRDAAK